MVSFWNPNSQSNHGGKHDIKQMMRWTHCQRSFCHTKLLVSNSKPSCWAAETRILTLYCQIWGLNPVWRKLKISLYVTFPFLQGIFWKSHCKSTFQKNFLRTHKFYRDTGTLHLGLYCWQYTHNELVTWPEKRRKFRIIKALRELKTIFRSSPTYIQKQCYYVLCCKNQNC